MWCCLFEIELLNLVTKMNTTDTYQYFNRHRWSHIQPFSKHWICFIKKWCYFNCEHEYEQSRWKRIDRRGFNGNFEHQRWRSTGTTHIWIKRINHQKSRWISIGFNGLLQFNIFEEVHVSILLSTHCWQTDPYHISMCMYACVIIYIIAFREQKLQESSTNSDGIKKPDAAKAKP